MNKQAHKRMTSARSVLIMEHPFFGCLVLHLKLVENPFITNTMATDGIHLFYDPNFVLAMPEEYLIGIQAHEAYHCAYKHHLRFGDRDAEDWNKACDYVVNADLLSQKFRLPDWVLFDRQYAGMSAEEIYNLLPKPPKQPKPQQGQGQPQGGQGQSEGQPSGGQQPDKQGQGQGKGDGTPDQGQAQGGGGQPQVKDPGRMGGILAPAPAWDTNTIESEAAKWEAIARQAVAVAKNQNAGQIPGFLERLVNDLEKPRVPWETVLRRFADDSISKDYTWMTPNRRYLHTGLTLPGLVSDKIAHAINVMDTSGSVDDVLVSKYAAEMRAMLDDGLMDKLTVIYADTVVQKVEVFERGDEVLLNPKGGGGTNFRDAFRYIAEECEEAAVIMFFTDLYTKDFGDDPGRPVLWTVYGDPRTYDHLASKIPFGETLFVTP